MAGTPSRSRYGRHAVRRRGRRITPLASLTLTAGSLGTTLGSGGVTGSVATTGAQTYNDAVTLGSDAAFDRPSASTWPQTVGWRHNLTVIDTGATQFVAAVAASRRSPR